MKVADGAEEGKEGVAQEVLQAPLTARLSAPLGDPRPSSVTWMSCERRSTFETTDATLAQPQRRPEVPEDG
jgi:hypothetical protein